MASSTPLNTIQVRIDFLPSRGTTVGFSDARNLTVPRPLADSPTQAGENYFPVESSIDDAVGDGVTIFGNVTLSNGVWETTLAQGDMSGPTGQEVPVVLKQACRKTIERLVSEISGEANPMVSPVGFSDTVWLEGSYIIDQHNKLLLGFPDRNVGYEIGRTAFERGPGVLVSPNVRDAIEPGRMVTVGFDAGTGAVTGVSVHNGRTGAVVDVPVTDTPTNLGSEQGRLEWRDDLVSAGEIDNYNSIRGLFVRSAVSSTRPIGPPNEWGDIPVEELEEPRRIGVKGSDRLLTLLPWLEQEQVRAQERAIDRWGLLSEADNSDASRNPGADDDGMWNL